MRIYELLRMRKRGVPLALLFVLFVLFGVVALPAVVSAQGTADEIDEFIEAEKTL